jgi:hypothetical protein
MRNMDLQITEGGGRSHLRPMCSEFYIKEFTYEKG